MDDLAVSYVKAHMIDPASVCVEHQISRLHLLCAHRSPLGSLGAGGTVHVNASCMFQHIAGKTGTVRSCIRIRAAVHIRISEESKGIVHHVLPDV